MRLNLMWLPLFISITLSIQYVQAQAKHVVRLRSRPAQQQQQRQQDQEYDSELEENFDDNRPQSAIQYYSAEPARDNSAQSRLVFVSSDDDYNGLYGQSTGSSGSGGSGGGRSRSDYNKQLSKIGSTTPRVKEQQQTKPPPVQTIRNYNKVNDDGSFTFGYEAADGSFKEETRGTDCVVRGKYGYIDPDGNKREFTYVSGNPCDPNNPDETSDQETDKNDEDSDEPENIPQNYPQQRPTLINRPAVKIIQSPKQQQQQQQYHHSTTVAPTTVFQNTYSQYQDEDTSQNDDDDDDDEQPDPIQLLQQQSPRPRVTPRPLQQTSAVPEEVTIRQRPKLTIVNTTPVSSYVTPTQSTNQVSITPRPTYRVPLQSLQTQPPATTYRPAIQFITQRPAPIVYKNKEQTLSVEPLTKTAYSSTRKPIDFAVEFQKFQQEHNVAASTGTAATGSTTRAPPTTYKTFKTPQIQKIELPINNHQQTGSNPIYESQLIFDPQTGQYDSALYQQLPQTDGEFTLNHRIQPYVSTSLQQQSPFSQFINFEQNSPQPIYQRPQAQPLQSQQPPQQSQHFTPQFSQQIYQKENENLQVLNSQQLFAQQQELQQQQLQQDRIEAANKRHRFQLQPQQQQQPLTAPQGYYFIQQPQQQSTGQIDAFLRGHNIDFN